MFAASRVLMYELAFLLRALRFWTAKMKHVHFFDA